MNQLMEDSKCDAASSSSTVAQSSACECVQPVATILRIRRKRTADPHDALIVSLKKSRKADKTSDDGITSLLYSLAGTSTTPVR
ncbi:unnamed protein product [Anisakis simplex]|uniref:Uncharacterized protein n=1 Tax=Anisakis simplex TaxID=6269 RepID=A0A0M3JK82_ANISI|nr:unnamed protein product [Anisakis simplex]